MYNRREFLGLAGAGALAACARNGTGGGSGGKAVIKHVFGETTVPAPPTRVVSAGLTEQDDLLAVGVVPIAVTNWFGDQPWGVWPWAQPKLGAAKPALLNLDNGIQVDKIAGLKPELIVAINAGLDADTYQKLSAIAPTIAQSGGDAFFEPWKDQARSVARAVFKSDEMARLIDTVEAGFISAGQANPAFANKTAVLLSGAFAGDAITATVDGWRTEFLTAMGLGIPDSLKGLAGSDGHAVIPRAELATALQSADVLIWATESDAAQAALLADPTIATLRNTSLDRNVFTGRDLAAAIDFASPLSYPLVAAQLPPMLARALG